MRERKYRAYNPETKEMIYFDLKKAVTDQFIAQHLISLLANDHGLGKDLLTEFTGLTAKNGVDIYESDIIEWSGAAIRFEVKWSQEDCGFICIRESCAGSMNQTYLDHFEIIGNIFENKELLAQGG